MLTRNYPKSLLVFVLSSTMSLTGMAQSKAPSSSKFILAKSNFDAKLVAELGDDSKIALPEIAKKKKKSADSSGDAGAEKKPESAAPGAAPNTIWYFMPLGAGQFVNGSPILGSLFLVAQLVGVGMGYSSYSAGSATYATGQKYADDNAKARPADYDKKIADYQAKQDSEFLQAYIFFGVAGGAYVLSMVEAFVDAPTGEPVDDKMKKKKKKKKKEEAPETTATNEIIEDFAWVAPRSHIGLYLNPRLTPNDQSLSLNVDYRF